jgi:hypothetical protein
MNMLFEAISEYGDDVMALKLYELFKNIGLVSNYNIFESFMNKIIQRERISESIHSERKFTISPKRTSSFASHRTIDYINKLDSIGKAPKEGNVFQKRILYKKNSEEVTEDIFFETDDTCMECRETIEFNTVSQSC